MTHSTSTYRRQFPSYTTRELEMTVARWESGYSMLDTDLINRIREEIMARHAGISKVRVTPQIEPLKVR